MKRISPLERKPKTDSKNCNVKEEEEEEQEEEEEEDDFVHLLHLSVIHHLIVNSRDEG